MKLYAILTEDKRGRRHDTGRCIRAESKSVALLMARASGFYGTLLALEIVDVEERAA